jgi:4-hydroxy-tetrahydrodipicolinate synthase
LERLRGVYAILATPFLPDGEVDEASLRRLTAATIEAGVDGITVLGVAGEAHKLDDAERHRVMASVLEVNASRVPVIVGTSRESTYTAINAAREVGEAGASGLMVAPPTFAQPGSALTTHFQRIGEAVGLPIVLQDYPPINGVTLSVQAIVDLVQAVPQITAIKVEDYPTPQRTAQILGLVANRVTVVGGLGGLYLLDELRSGSSGTMTGFAYPEVLVAIWRAWSSGNVSLATTLYHRYLPLILFEGQPKVGLAIRKEILRRRGLIAHPTVREPAPKIDDQTLSVLAQTLADIDVDAAISSGALSSADLS